MLCVEPDCMQPAVKHSGFCAYHKGKLDRVHRIFERIKDTVSVDDVRIEKDAL